MALQVSLTSLQQESCTEWVLTEATGTYDAVSNTDGWKTAASGGTNLQIDNDSVTYATLTVTYSSGTAVVIDIIDNWAALTGLSNTAFDSSTDPENLSYTLTSTLLGTTGIADGIYEVTYQVGDGTTYANSTKKSTITYTYALYCQIECCLEQRLVQVPTEYACETCSNDFINTTTILWTLLQALKMAACSASTTKFETILETLQDACSTAGCDCD